MTASATELRAYQALRAPGELTARIYSMQNASDRRAVQGGRPRPASATTGCGIGGLKIFADGSMGAGTAAFFEPYTDDSVDARPADPRAR